MTPLTVSSSTLASLGLGDWNPLIVAPKVGVAVARLATCVMAGCKALLGKDGLLLPLLLVRPRIVFGRMDALLPFDLNARDSSPSSES